MAEQSDALRATLPDTWTLSVLLKINSHTYRCAVFWFLPAFFSTADPSISPSSHSLSVGQSPKHKQAGRMNGTELLWMQSHVAMNIM